MKTVAILSEIIDGNGTIYRAVGDGVQCTGRSAGEALDGLAARLDPSQSGTLIVIQTFSPDGFFGADQSRRLGELMVKWRAARDAGVMLSADEQAELDALARAELDGALQRTRELQRELRA